MPAAERYQTPRNGKRVGVQEALDQLERTAVVPMQFVGASAGSSSSSGSIWRTVVWRIIDDVHGQVAAARPLQRGSIIADSGGALRRGARRAIRMRHRAALLWERIREICYDAIAASVSNLEQARPRRRTNSQTTNAILTNYATIPRYTKLLMQLLAVVFFAVPPPRRLPASSCIASSAAAHQQRNQHGQFPGRPEIISLSCRGWIAGGWFFPGLRGRAYRPLVPRVRIEPR